MAKLSFLSRIKYAMDAITSFSYKPLRLCFVLSLFSLHVRPSGGVHHPFEQPDESIGIWRGGCSLSGGMPTASVPGCAW